MKIFEATGLTAYQLMRNDLKPLSRRHNHKTKKKKSVKDEGYGTTGGASNPPLSKHLTPTMSPIYGSWI
jgi:hypothetical protein